MNQGKVVSMKWLKKAESDLALAKLAMSEGFIDWAQLAAQQVLENSAGWWHGANNSFKP